MNERNLPQVQQPDGYAHISKDAGFFILESVIFDLDGTLFDSAAGILYTLRKSLMAAGINCTAEKFRPEAIGPPLEEIIDNVCPGLDRELHGRVVMHYRKAYQECVVAHSKLYPYVRDQLELLHNSGIRLFAASYKPKDASWRLLHGHGIHSLFHGTMHSDSVPGRRIDKAAMLMRLVRQYGINTKLCLMQGDGTGDISAAKECGMFTAAALYGYGSSEMLLAARPDICLPAMDWRTGTVCADGRPFRWKSITDIEGS